MIPMCKRVFEFNNTYEYFFYLLHNIATLLTDDNSNRYLTFRTYRAEKTYAVSSGKWLVITRYNYLKYFYSYPFYLT